MLKLEKIAKSHDVNIILNRRSRFFSKTFLWALVYAVLLHGTALLIFTVPSFVIHEPDSQIRPVFVASELSDNQMIKDLSLSLKTMEDLIPAYLIIPLPPLPILPKVTWTPSTAVIGHKEQLTYLVQYNSFSSLENDLLFPISEQILNGPTPQNSLSIFISGPLANEPWQSNFLYQSSLGSLQEQYPSLKNASPVRYIYDVLVDRSRGMVCWWDIHYADDNKLLQNLALDILLQLKFAVVESKFIDWGKVEIIIAPAKIIGNNVST